MMKIQPVRKGGIPSMKYEKQGQTNFFLEMEHHQITAREFFSPTLLNFLNKNFDLNQMIILYFDTQNHFLSWVNQEGLLLDEEKHPYRQIFSLDPVRKVVYTDALRDHLTYFNTIPRLYKSTDVIPPNQYDSDPYVRFIQTYFQAKYSVTMAFGINAYIQMTFFKEAEKGDFTDEEMQHFSEIYAYIANSYKNFKKYEQAKIISEIKNHIIDSGEKAYLITDDFMHVMDCNKETELCLQDILGPSVRNQLEGEGVCGWLPFLLSSGEKEEEGDKVRIRMIQNYQFRIYTYDRSYSNRIIDRYHWITISSKGSRKHVEFTRNLEPLTATEQRVAELMYQGLTYKAIAMRLVVSYHTVKKRVENIYAKCGIQSRYQLYKWIESREN
jgi:DNA-binding CsgD family transcriptional regulator